MSRHIHNDPWWHVLGLCSGLAFAVMLMIARLYPDWFDHLDDMFEHAVQPLQTFGHAEFFLIITVLGSGIGISVVGLGAAYLLRRNRYAVLQLILLYTLCWSSMWLAKVFVERARPDAISWVVTLNSYSFPSGHATLSSAIYGFFAVCLYRRSSTTFARILSILIPILIIVLVCVSRIVLGYHYFTDVLAGILLGSFWLCVVFMLPKHRLEKFVGLARR